MTKNPYQAYKSAAYTVSKTKQVVMLYDAVIRNLSQAKDAMMNGRIEDRYHKLVRASEIIAGLQMSLDFDKGLDTAKQLYDFYSLLESRINSLHRHADVILCDALIHELREMREMWHQIDTGEKEVVAETAPMAMGTADLVEPAPALQMQPVQQMAFSA